MKLSLSLAVAGVLAVTISFPFVIADDDDDDDERQQPPIRSIAEDLPYDENGKLESHFLLYPVGTCSDNVVASFQVPYGFQKRAVEGSAMETLFPEAKPDGECQAVCVERGVDKSVAGAIMPDKYYDDDNDEELEFEDWFRRCHQVEVCLINYYSEDYPIHLYWMKEIGENRYEKIYHSEVPYGGTARGGDCLKSFIGHGFQAEDSETGEVLGTFKVRYTMTMVFGELLESDDPEEHDNFEKEIVETLHSEWNRHSSVKRTFSPLGFKKGRLPDDVFASMGAFYYNNRWNKVREEWGGGGVFVNWWETDCSFIRIPPGLNSLWAERLKELVEAWVGMPLEETSLYGLRQYETGARLLTHVDMMETHAASLIVNIAQGNMTEPWPVEVHDHADRLHEVIMEPGDVVYYESAKALHGRNQPLAGENAYYVNLFTHYRPIGDDEWYKRPNPEGTPEPVLDVKGECRVRAGDMGNNNDNGGLGAVECDDERLGSYVSPSLFTATSGDDLVDWWRKTAPKESDAVDAKDEL